MLVKIFGLLDLIAAILLVSLKWGIGKNIGWIFAIYLIVKSIVFFGSWMNILDVIAGSLIIAEIFGYYLTLSWIFVVWLMYKFFVSYSDL